jgi:ribosomal-protein-serine acetyltransferase
MLIAPDRGRLPEAPYSLELDDGIYLRHLTLGDAPIVFRTVDENREALRRWLPWVDTTGSVADTIRFLQHSEAQRLEGTALVYGLWSELDFCGTIGLHAIDLNNSNAQIGYWLSPAAQGRGTMTQACAAVLGISFEILGLERMEIRCGTGNFKSCAIPQRLGFTLEGIARRLVRLPGGFEDFCIYSLLLEDYRAKLSLAE